MAGKEEGVGQTGEEKVVNEITETRIQPGCETTLQEEKCFLARLFAAGIGHDVWFVLNTSEKADGGKENG